MVSNMALWQGLADAVLVIHAAYVLFVVGGQALIVIGCFQRWEWTRCRMFRLMHLVAICFVMLETWLGISCPLTILENYLRLQADFAAYKNSFIDHWVRWAIFYAAPEWIFTLIYTAFTMLVILTWLAYPPRWKPK